MYGTMMSTENAPLVVLSVAFVWYTVVYLVLSLKGWSTKLMKARLILFFKISLPLFVYWLYLVRCMLVGECVTFAWLHVLIAVLYYIVWSLIEYYIASLREFIKDMLQSVISNKKERVRVR